jgi:mono/diheme cytochrome c family protein
MKKNLLLITAISVGLGVRLSGAEAKVDFPKDIQPILQQTCVKCHGPEKQKGKLRLDSREAALKGGGEGPALVAGDADKSEMFRRITLPKDHDDFMPSEGDPLSKAQIDLIRDWINQGAVWPETASVKAPEPSEAADPDLPGEHKPSAAELKAIEKLAQAGVDIRPIAMNVNWREANFRLHGTNIADASIAPLKDVLGLVDLNLAATKITDAGLAHLKGLTNLTRLHLELTSITDTGLAHLKSLKRLRYLNLYGTQVTDAGLEGLKDLPRLRSLYVWQTKVTTNGVENLKKALPKVDISTGWDVTTLAKKEDKEENKEEKK